MKTQNSGITAKGDHFTARMKKSESFDHYGRVTEVIQLSYNDKENTRDVVLFKCHWYDQDRNMGRAPRNDGNFISINTTAQWYKNEPYILVPQASKVMFLDDRTNPNWKYVQKFQPRNIYDVDENKPPLEEVAHQDDFCGSGETEDDDEILMDTCDHAHDGEVDFTVEVSIIDKEIKKLNLPNESPDTYDEHEEDDDPICSEYMNDIGTRNESDDDDD